MKEPKWYGVVGNLPMGCPVEVRGAVSTLRSIRLGRSVVGEEAEAWWACLELSTQELGHALLMIIGDEEEFRATLDRPAEVIPGRDLGEYLRLETDEDIEAVYELVTEKKSGLPLSPMPNGRISVIELGTEDGDFRLEIFTDDSYRLFEMEEAGPIEANGHEIT